MPAAALSAQQCDSEAVVDLPQATTSFPLDGITKSMMHAVFTKVASPYRKLGELEWCSETLDHALELMTRDKGFEYLMQFPIIVVYIEARDETAPSRKTK